MAQIEEETSSESIKTQFPPEWDIPPAIQRNIEQSLKKTAVDMIKAGATGIPDDLSKEIEKSIGIEEVTQTGLLKSKDLPTFSGFVVAFERDKAVIARLNGVCDIVLATGEVSNTQFRGEVYKPLHSLNEIRATVVRLVNR